MKLLVIGLGSMGKRRIRLLKEISDEFYIAGVDSNSIRAAEIRDNLEIITYTSLEDALVEKYDCAVISTSPLTHSSIIKRLLPYDFYIFTELNLVQDDYDYFITHKNYGKLFLSSTLLYRKDIEYICNRVENKKVIYSYHVGQYLPDWHPWENYKNFFVSDSRTNGCREIMAIDFPWLIKAFGKITNVTVQKSKISALDVNYSDNYLLLLEHENGTKGSVIIDIVSRRAVRKFETFNENMHLFWEGTPSSLYEYDLLSKSLIPVDCYDKIEKNKDYSENIIENAYKDELITFLDLVKNDNNQAKYTFKDDKETLKLIDTIENSNE